MENYVPAFSTSAFSIMGYLVDMNDLVVRLAFNVANIQRSFEFSFPHSLKVKVIYDDNFKGKFGDDVVNAARRVMAQAQNAFMWKDSLKTIVKFKVDENVDYHPGKWVAKTDM